MLFDVRYFEQLLDERILKKGLRLFESGSVELVEKSPGNETHFLVDAQSFTLKKKADRLISYTCSCGKSSFCEHLAAVLFYFQQDALGLSVKKGGNKRSRSKQSRYALTTPFDLTVIALKEWLMPYLALKALDQNQLNTIYEEALRLKKSVNAQQRFDMNLALISTVPLVFQLRLLGDELQLKILLKECVKELKHSIGGGLSNTQQADWYKATLEAVKNNAVLRSDVFTFLIPYAVSFITAAPDLERLKQLLGKRAYKFTYASRFDKLAIAKLEIAIKEAELLKLPFALGDQAKTIEFIMATAELFFCSNKIVKAFNYLASKDAFVKQNYAFYYMAYFDYIIDKAREENKPEIEIIYLEKSFVYNVHILPKHLERFVDMVPAEQLHEKVDALITQLKNKNDENVFDKIADLLYRTNRFTELIRELKRHHNQFSLLQKVLLKRLPDYDEESLTLLLKHTLEAFSEAGFYHFQQNTFNKVKAYLDQLPEKTGHAFVSDLLDRIGRNKQISRYILGLYTSAL